MIIKLQASRRFVSSSCSIELPGSRTGSEIAVAVPGAEAREPECGGGGRVHPHVAPAWHAAGARLGQGPQHHHLQVRHQNISPLSAFAFLCLVCCMIVSRFSSNWDCDPLLPLSVWVGILITLLLASILLWAGGHSNDAHCRASGGMAIFLGVSAAPERILLSKISYAPVQHSSLHHKVLLCAHIIVSHG